MASARGICGTLGARTDVHAASARRRLWRSFLKSCRLEANSEPSRARAISMPDGKHTRTRHGVGGGRRAGTSGRNPVPGAWRLGILILCALPSLAGNAADATISAAASRALNALKPNYGVVLGHASVTGNINDVARRFRLHETG